MNIRCIFGHKWELSKQEREIHYDIPSWNLSGANLKTLCSWKRISVKLTDDIRICQRCYKKQKAIKSGLHKPLILGWENDELSKDELRDKKLSKLGI